MSHVPAKIRTTPAHLKCPNAARPAAMKVRANPTTVIWLGVTGERPSADISASAWRRTHDSNRVVYTCPLELSGRPRGHVFARLVVNLEHIGGDLVPRVATRFLQGVVGEPAAQLFIPGEDAERRCELAPVFGWHGDTVASRFENRHVPGDLGRDDRQPRRQSLEQDDAEALRTGGLRTEDVGAVAV